jgi:hypothetical protein
LPLQVKRTDNECCSHRCETACLSSSSSSCSSLPSFPSFSLSPSSCLLSSLSSSFPCCIVRQRQRQTPEKSNIPWQTIDPNNSPTNCHPDHCGPPFPLLFPLFPLSLLPSAVTPHWDITLSLPTPLLCLFSHFFFVSSLLFCLIHSDRWTLIHFTSNLSSSVSSPPFIPHLSFIHSLVSSLPRSLTRVVVNAESIPRLDNVSAQQQQHQR